MTTADPLRRLETEVHRAVTNATAVALDHLKAARRLTQDDFVLSGPTTDTEETTVDHLINLTPHPIDIQTMNDEIATIPPEPEPARVAEAYGADIILATQIGQIPAIEGLTPLHVYGLPGPAPGTIYIVSRPVAAACPERRDLAITEGLVRDGQGRITHCRALAFLAPAGGAA